MHDLWNTADRRRDHGSPDRERLDRGVREVLPARRQEQRVRRAQQVEHALARLGAEEAHASVEAELGRAPLQPHALLPVARDDERDALEWRQRLERDAERLRGRQPSGEHERRAGEAELGAERLGIAQRRQLGRRVREHRDARRIESPAEDDPPQELARREDVPHAGHREAGLHVVEDPAKASRSGRVAVLFAEESVAGKEPV